MSYILSRAGRAAVLALLVTSPLATAEGPKVTRLEIQKVDDTTYFAVWLRQPADLRMFTVGWSAVPDVVLARAFELARLPRLVPQDDRTAAVYLQAKQRSGDDLGFVGKVKGKGPARLLLVYPTRKKDVAGKKEFSLAPSLPGWTWGEALVTLDFDKAKRIELPDRERTELLDPADDDLEGRWAAGQAQQFAVLEAQAADFSFYAQARQLTMQKYRVPGHPLVRRDDGSADAARLRLYETTTGAAALTESLAMHRLLRKRKPETVERTIAIDKVRGIDIAEHPWAKMMAGKKPAADPLASLVPFDNYYVAFKNIGTLLEFADLLDDWGTNLLRAYELTSRDFRLRQRYEKQLCLRSTGLARTLGPALVRGVALTGSDLYIREGTDVTVIFHVNNKALFLAAAQPFVDEARKGFKGRLKEKKAKYRGVEVESFVTPLREVSLHRAAFGDYVVYSNSPVGLRRILDVRDKRIKALSDMRDFQYMRTVFRRGDKEDGFAFLSDAFIRQLVGPASKIKEKRRLEALTSLAMVTNGALFAAWETGRLPKDHPALVAATGLESAYVPVPEGKGVEWDGKRRVAVSDAYNTMHFATPLIELPIDQVTKQEAEDYEDFRRGYLRNWRQYFDPVGMRFGLRNGQVRVETYILPLIDSDHYSGLRSLTGNGTAALELAMIPPNTLFQFSIHINPTLWFFGFPPKDALGDWAFVRWDDSRGLRELARLWVEDDLGSNNTAKSEQRGSRLFWQLPLTFGVRMGKEKQFDKMLADFQRDRDKYTASLTREVMKPPYKGIPITRTRFDPRDSIGPDPNPKGTPKHKRLLVSWYHAKVDGAWYLSFNFDSLRAVIDRAVARRDGKLVKDEVKVNTSLYLAPEAALDAAGALRSYLEWKTFRRAVGNGPLWEALYRTGVAEGVDSDKQTGAALHYLGFVPVSPDGLPYRYDRRTGLVPNTRHGSYGMPRLHDDLAETSPVARLLGQLRTIRADLRFREDGVQTVLTIQRKKGAK